MMRLPEQISVPAFSLPSFVKRVESSQSSQNTDLTVPYLSRHRPVQKIERPRNRVGRRRPNR